MSEPTKKILVVDDDEDILELTSFSLKQQGYAVATGKNGVEALQITQEFKPDVILLDIMMPIMDGYHVANRIMNDATITKKPKIVLVTSRDVARDGKLLEFSGASGTIQKPFSIAKLKQLLQELAP